MRRTLALWGIVVLLGPAALAKGPRKLKPGFNLFSKEQDVQLGREAAAQIETQLPVIDNRELNEYIGRVGRKLTSRPEADRYPYSFKVVHNESINAFALPGGPMFIHTGLVTAVENEAQLAGVMAHEIAHVALRHGTNQVSKANLIQLPAMLAGMAAGGSLMGQLAQIGIGAGSGSLLMKFSRTAERDADLLGARIMAGASYNPLEMARFFEKLEAETGRQGRLAEFFSDHPNPGNRVKAVEEEITYMKRREYTTGDPATLRQAQQVVQQLPAPRKPQAQRQIALRGGPVSEARPSGRYKEFEGRAVRISHPDNWQVHTSPNAADATIAPPAGIHPGPANTPVIAYGAMLSLQQVQDRAADLGRATEEFLAAIRRDNPSMKPGLDRNVLVQVDGAQALLNSFTSQSAWKGETEIDIVVTTLRPQGLFAVVFIAPESEMGAAQPVFQEMLRSIRFAN